MRRETLRVAAEDLHLDLVDVVLQPVQHGAVVVDDLVQHRVEDRVRPLAQQLRVGLQPGAHLAEVGLRGVPHRDDEVGPEEQVDLADLDLFVVVDVAGRPQHDEQHVAVLLQLRALVGVDRVLDREGVQAELLRDRPDLRLVGAQHADPAEAVAARRAGVQRLEGLVEGVGHDSALPVDVDRVVDHRHALLPRLVPTEGNRRRTDVSNARSAAIAAFGQVGGIRSALRAAVGRSAIVRDRSRPNRSFCYR